MNFLLLFLLGFFSWLLTGALRRYAHGRSLMDIPNARSSHSVPTARGGGLSIVVTYLVAIVVLSYLGYVWLDVGIGLLGAGMGIALLGFLDDHGHVAARWRLLGHFGAAVWVLFWVGGMPPLAVFGTTWNWGAFGYVIGALYLVWLLNLYNFMDGIDGIASVEAICVCAGGVLLVAASWVVDSTALLLPLALGAAVLGFLVWNFPPAKIFMGDAGSGFLGIMLGALSLQAASLNPQWFWSWLILLGVFVVDATFTLFRRLLRGDKVYEAHRSHAYQYASRHYGRHLPVTLAVLMINVLWLIPLALCVGFGLLEGVLGLVVAYLPLVLLAIRFHAGELEKAQ